jgi:FKBP-type peptidyl-prolyl cis-trans isomerase FkpA
MYKIYLIALLTLVSFGCKKDDNNCSYRISAKTAPANQKDSLRHWLSDQNIQATEHPDGFFFVLNQAGSGKVPNACSNVLFHYTGSFLDGRVFESNPTTGTNMVVGEVVPGLQKTLVLMKSGGSITTYLPPALAYGNSVMRDYNGQVIIPAGSYLIFQINLIDVD